MKRGIVLYIQQNNDVHTCRCQMTCKSSLNMVTSFMSIYTSVVISIIIRENTILYIYIFIFI